jgi:hypothetical protein
MDPKAWIFMLYAALANFVGGMGVQYSLIIKDFGFNVMQTTLLNIPQGAMSVIVITSGMWLLRKFPVSECLGFFICNVSSILASFSPSSTLCCFSEYIFSRIREHGSHLVSMFPLSPL